MMESHFQEGEQSFLSGVIRVAQRRRSMVAKELDLNGACKLTSDDQDDVGQDQTADARELALIPECAATDIVSMVMSMRASKATKYVASRFMDGNIEVAMAFFWTHAQRIADAKIMERPDIFACESPRQALEKMLPASTVEALAVDMQKAMDSESHSYREACAALPASRSHVVLVWFLRLGQATEIDLGGIGFAKQPLKAADILQVVPVCAKMVESACFASWFIATCLDKNALVLESNDEKGGELPRMEYNSLIKDALVFAKETVQTLRDIATPSVSLLTDVEAHLVLGPKQALMWCDALSALTEFVAKQALRRLGDKIDEVAEQCEKMTPRWGHIVSDDSYKQTLVRRQLLNSPSRHSLLAVAARLTSLLESTRESSLIVGGVAADDDATISDAMANGIAVFDASSDAVSLMAALNIIEDFGMTPDGKKLASSFLTEALFKGFPKAVEAKLRRIADC